MCWKECGGHDTAQHQHCKFAKGFHMTRNFWIRLLIGTAALGTALLHVSAIPIQSLNPYTAFTLPMGQQFTNTGRRLVSISPDGTQVVYVADTQLFLYRVGEKTSRAIPGALMTQG